MSRTKPTADSPENGGTDGDNNAQAPEVFVDEAPRVSMTDSLDMGDAADKVRSLADELIAEGEDDGDDDV